MNPSRRLILAGGAALSATACQSPGTPPAAVAWPAVGRIVRDDPALDRLIAPDARIEKLAEGFTWSEGPVWIAEGGYLLFSDVPENRIHRWSEADGASVFMSPSGYDGPDASSFREPGSNGLIAGRAGSILMADHGNRAIARVELATRAKTLLATRYQGRRFNSPNDLVQAANGAIFFTDPPYGLKDMDQSPLKELPHNGVYRLDPDGEVTLLEDGLTFPNGVALSPDQRTLYVAVSDPERAVIMAYDLNPAGQTSGGRVLRDFTSLVGPSNPGLPDGMAIDAGGHLFATGPGGVHVLSPDGRSLGRIDTGTAAANCKFGEDGRTLFITSGPFLARLRTLTRG
ncbi:SMP-30/gluconolactonase/LRE family protein [Brevundimonas sp.]|uniref:SMP-30/gluconolactonase/LRE family protein n=1 Tax=Brevundimonas sp. TaxID=1871086 RepID=UPI002737C6F1|nr:SMP-30/gluconolactonase/LRE family protein [Brevundimonas sp.]MDP3803491.1 SMP-30/gluconolactonase/LRE family protein [Brevundimonas sp.]